MEREEDLRWKIDVRNDQLSDFESFRDSLREAGLDLDESSSVSPAISNPLIRKHLTRERTKFGESRRGLYGQIGEIAAERARLQAELDELEDRSR